MTPQQRLYCYVCRRSLSVNSFDSTQSESSKVRICQICIKRLQEKGTMVTSEVVIETERMIQLALQGREGGQREVETPAGLVDVVTDEYAIEIKHVSNWKDGAKVLFYNQFLKGKKPRVHFFGGYSSASKDLIEQCYSAVGVAVTWEEPDSF
jgi:hypothetical protein